MRVPRTIVAVAAASEEAEIVSSGSFDLDTIVESGHRFGTALDLNSIQPLLDAYDLQFRI